MRASTGGPGRPTGSRADGLSHPVVRFLARPNADPIASSFAADRRCSGPRPFWGGRWSERVLGMTTWPAASTGVRPAGGRAYLFAGLSGVGSASSPASWPSLLCENPPGGRLEVAMNAPAGRSMQDHRVPPPAAGGGLDCYRTIANCRGLASSRTGPLQGPDLDDAADSNGGGRQLFPRRGRSRRYRTDLVAQSERQLST